jgi:methyl coenzyme M reductase beta subunit
MTMPSTPPTRRGIGGKIASSIMIVVACIIVGPLAAAILVFISLVATTIGRDSIDIGFALAAAVGMSYVFGGAIAACTAPGSLDTSLI